MSRKKISKREFGEKSSPDSAAEEAGEPMIERKEENAATAVDNNRAKMKRGKKNAKSAKN